MPSPSPRILRAFTPASALAAASALIAFTVAVGSMVALYSTYASRTDAAVAGAREKEYETKFRDRIKRYEAQIIGRSMFIPPRVSSSEIAESPSATDDQPKLPTHYAGPSIIAMINSTVWFSDGRRIPVGKSDNDLKVVSINPPWSARILWQGVEFDVGLFSRDELIYKTDSQSRSRNFVPAPGLSSTVSPSTSSAPASASTGNTQPSPASPSRNPVPPPHPTPEPVQVQIELASPADTPQDSPSSSEPPTEPEN